MKAMTVINAVQIFLLLWGFTTVSQADAANCGVTCNDVTGTVGNEVILACSVCGQSTTGCVKLYKFQNSGSDIYKEVFPEGVCEKTSIFIRRYSPDKAMKGAFSFFVQVGGCTETKYFTVNISEAVNSTISKSEAHPLHGKQLQDSEAPKHEEKPVSAISAGVGCIIIFVIIIILTIIIIYKKHRGKIQERKKFQAVRQNDDDDDKTENV
ncbi:uncharacterized protein LOC130238639 [Danio aesculapii]|uniref:uncharacterized protein LOC130238639 n=1 Tax=Danio aesculapii TaxID=1142201 RepID=UPI0024C091B7|nr:uncharacterized protein LOC130238639 [Danio aesculapii]